MILMFVVPLLFKRPEQSRVLNFCNSKLYQVFPVVMWHYWDRDFVTEDAEWSYEDLGIDVVTQNVMLLSMQVSFGMAVPWLSVVIWLTMCVCSVSWVAVYYEVSRASPEVLEKVLLPPGLPKSTFLMMGLVMSCSLSWLLVDQMDNSDPSRAPSYICGVVFVLLSALSFSSRGILRRTYYGSGSEASRGNVDVEMTPHETIANPMTLS